MSTTKTTTMTTAQVAGLILGHLAEYDLPEPGSLFLAPDDYRGASIRVQIGGTRRGLAEVAGVLLAWANSFPSVRVSAWLPPTGTAVHLDVDATVSGAAGQAAVTVYAGTRHDLATFGRLEPDERRPVTLGQLTAWATGTGVAA